MASCSEKHAGLEDQRSRIQSGDCQLSLEQCNRMQLLQPTDKTLPVEVAAFVRLDESLLNGLIGKCMGNAGQ